MSLLPPRCTCAERQHGCSPPCPAHPELGGGLGNPGVLKDGLPAGFPSDPMVEAWFDRAERDAG